MSSRSRPTEAEIRARIADLETEREVARKKLGPALLAGGDTGPLRAAMARIDSELADLHAQLEQTAAQEEADAAEMSGAQAIALTRSAHDRITASLGVLQPPPQPKRHKGS